jgi:hypothetical protein
VPDIEAKLAEVTTAGATVKEPAREVGGGRLVATVTDPDGNAIGLLQTDEHRPPKGLGGRVRREFGYKSQLDALARHLGH